MTTKRPASHPRPETSQPQLVLVLDSMTDTARWQLDDETKEIGRKGLAQARAALQAARSTQFDMAA